MNLTPAINMRHHGKHLQSLWHTSGPINPCLPQLTLPQQPNIPIAENTPPPPQKKHTDNPSAHTILLQRGYTCKKAHTQPAASSGQFSPLLCPLISRKMTSRTQGCSSRSPQHTHANILHIWPRRHSSSCLRIKDGECRVTSPSGSVPYVTRNKNIQCPLITTLIFILTLSGSKWCKDTC